MDVQETHAYYKFGKEIEEIKKTFRLITNNLNRQNKELFQSIEILSSEIESCSKKCDDIKLKNDELAKIVIEIYKIVSGGGDGDRTGQTV